MNTTTRERTVMQESFIVFFMLSNIDNILKCVGKSLLGLEIRKVKFIVTIKKKQFINL